MKAVALFVAAVLLAACAEQQAEPPPHKLVITKAVWQDYLDYKAWLTQFGRGFYAVTEDGVGGRGHGCPANNCGGISMARDLAIKACEDINPGRKCIIFAENLEIVVPYEIAP